MGQLSVCQTKKAHLSRNRSAGKPYFKGEVYLETPVHPWLPESGKGGLP